jgi:S-adenosylmethionine:diacylglycerol 3-amino-3-carboxypropyl transferase
MRQFSSNSPVIVSLSNLPAYVSKQQHLALWQSFAQNLPSGSLVVGRHFLRHIDLPVEVSSQFEVLSDLARDLTALDRSFIYDIFVVRRS